MMKPRISDVPVALTTAVWLFTTRIVIARTGFRGAIKRYDLQPATDAEAPAPLSPSVRRAVKVAERVVRMPIFGATCLPRALAIARVVARQGVRADLVLGVTPLVGFEAHAWVEAGGLRIDPAYYPEGTYVSAGRFTLEPSWLNARARMMEADGE